MNRPATFGPIAVLAAVLTAASVPAQRARTIVPAAPGMLAVEPPQEEAGNIPELGVRAQLIESQNLDRFLRRSQEFLDRRDYAGAISVLQDAIEGRVVHDQLPAAKAPPVEDPAGAKERGESAEDPFTDEDDPGKAVYSADGRLYRPVLRLCHELLASLPPEGLDLYRTRFEVEAERQYAAALAGRDQPALEALARRFFATDAAARALDATADLLLDAGRFKAAADVLRTLRDVHPRFRDGEGLAGLSALDVDVELALCHRLASEPVAAAALLQEIGVRYAAASVRIMGDLVPVTALPSHPLFSGGIDVAPAPAAAAPEHELAVEDFAALVPIWQRRFADGRPYATPAATSNQRIVMVAEGGTGGAVPLARLGEPGNSGVRFGSQLVYMEHNRVRVHDLASGRLLLEGDGEVTPYRPDAGQAPPRVALYDFATMRVTADEQRFYVVLVPRRGLRGAAAVLENRLVALDRRTLEPRWSAGHGGDSDEFRAVTFLATPTVLHERLLVPVLTRGVYGLQCLDARTGASLFRTALHSGGTDLVRTPGCHVVVDRDTAFVLTNAGVIAAIDAHSGVVRWLRRYERLDPFRTHRVTRAARNQQPRFGAMISMVNTLPGFALPSEMMLRAGKLILAPTDGRCLLCLDAASGEIDWLLTPSHTDYILGDDGERLFLAGKRLLCIDLRTGIQLWDSDVPEPAAQGRGTVVGDLVVMPGERGLYVLKTTGSASWQARELPGFIAGQEPLATRPKLSVVGPYLVASHSGGVEVFGLVRLLRAQAASAATPLVRARLLQHAGDLAAAIDVIGAALDGGAAAGERAALVREVLPLAQEVALAMAVVQQREPALQLLARVRPWLTAQADIESWHLAKVEVLRALNDGNGALAELEELRALAAGGAR